MTQLLRFGPSTRRGGFDQRHNFLGYFVKIRLAAKNSARIDVHILGHFPEGFGVPCDLDDWRDGGTDNRSTAGREKRQVSTTRHQLHDFRVVRDIRKPEFGRPIRDDIEQIQSVSARYFGGLDDTRYGSMAGLD